MGDPRDDETICAAWDEWNRNTPEKFWDVAVWIKEGKGDRDVRFGSLDAGNRFEIWAHGYAAARAVVEAADTEDEPLCRCGHARIEHAYVHQDGPCGAWADGCRNFTPSASPARDDVVAIADVLEGHYRKGDQCKCGEPTDRTYGLGAHNHRMHVASVIAAHMAAPDELTALRERVAELEKGRKGRFGVYRRCMEMVREARAERDVLRERIRALADEWEDLDHKDHCWDCDRGSDLRKLLGDA